jgi:uncharacterized protein YacL
VIPRPVEPDPGYAGEGKEPLLATTSRTARTLAQIAGPFLVLFGLSLALRQGELAAVLDALQHEPAVTFVLALVTLLIGLVMLAYQHTWRTPLEVVLSLLGVLTAVRGAALLLIPNFVAAMAAQALAAHATAWIAAAVLILLGLWLAYEGFLKKSTAL